MSQNPGRVIARVALLGLLAASVGVALAPPAHAEDLKGRWYVGGNISFLSTTDSIRSNAQIILGPVGDDGIPFTGDPNEEQGCTTQSANSYCDRRPDDLLSREAVIEETFRYELSAGFGFTSWLNVQLDAGYFKGSVGPVDTFLRDHFPVANSPTNPFILNAYKDRELSIPLDVGEVTEIPVSLSAVARFRKDSPMNPYVGIGGGMIFSNVEKSGDVDALNQRVAAMRIRGVANEYDRDILPASLASLKADGRVPFLWPLEVTVDDAFEWHLMGGAEYFFNDKVSMVFDARYMFADQDVQMMLGGEDQINLIIFSEKLFNTDGTLKIFAPSPVAPNTLCSDVNYRGFGCNNLTRPPGQRVNPQGNSDPNNPQSSGVQCPAIGDFDRNGTSDQCYGISINPSPTGITEPRGDVVIQGGKISLTGFSVAVGMRFHW